MNVSSDPKGQVCSAFFTVSEAVYRYTNVNLPADLGAALPAAQEAVAANARLAAGEGSALRAACAGLLGIRRVARAPDDPPGEFLVHFSDYSPALQAGLGAVSGAEVLELGRPALAEGYLEVLGDHAEAA